MDERDEDTQPHDKEPTIISSEDQEIKEKKPPNDKIIYCKIVENDKNSDF
ncbi:MAG: hypothetical protein ACFFB0_01815 [Promethearchaeota archaeon]